MRRRNAFATRRGPWSTPHHGTQCGSGTAPAMSQHARRHLWHTRQRYLCHQRRTPPTLVAQNAPPERKRRLSVQQQCGGAVFCGAGSRNETVRCLTRKFVPAKRTKKSPGGGMESDSMAAETKGMASARQA